MRRNVLLTAAIAVTLATTACQPDDSSLRKKLDEMQQDLAAIKQLVARGAGAGAGAPGRGQAPGPRPVSTDVFAVRTEGAPSVGPADAKVTVVKAFEFACPFCERVRPTMDQLRKDYGDDIRIVYKHYVVHPDVATLPAQAACAAGLQGKFEAMYDGIWDKGFKNNRDLSAATLDKIAGEIGLDMAKFKADITGSCQKIVQTDQAELGQVGVQGTPAFYINGRFLSGAQPLPQFKALVDEELKKANDRIAKGEASKADYYKKFVVDKGKKSTN